MASKIKVDQIEGSTGSSITIPTGQTLTIADGLASSSLPTVPVSKGGTGLTSLGTANQVVAVNSGASALEFQDASSGKIGQVLSFVKTSVFSTTNGISGTGMTATGLQIQITPSATTSKILVMPSYNLSSSNRSYSSLFINGSVSPFIGDALGSCSRVTHGYYNDTHHTTSMAGYTYLHSPSSTSQQTYEIYVCSNSSDGTYSTYLNRHQSSSGSSASDETSASSITVMEILA